MIFQRADELVLACKHDIDECKNAYVCTHIFFFWGGGVDVCMMCFIMVINFTLIKTIGTVKIYNSNFFMYMYALT